MFILDKPYVSDELIKYLIDSQSVVLRNKTAEEIKETKSLNIVDKETFIKKYYEGERIYTASENSLDWIYHNISDKELIRGINMMKDKVTFRKVLGNIYPDFFFREAELAELIQMDFNELKTPFILKPSIGFFSVGVYTIYSKTDWEKALADISAQAEIWKEEFDTSVVGNSKFILEEYIDGEEYAIDAYFNEKGKAVIVNIMKHDFASKEDVSDRLYYTSKEVIEEKLESFTQYLDKVNEELKLVNIPTHIEIRVDGDKTVPIEFNPMRFAGLCCTDLTHFAWGYYTYDYYLRDMVPDWKNLLKGKENKLYTMVLLDKPLMEETDKRFDYDKLCQEFKKVIHLRKTENEDFPVYGFVFTETNREDFKELEHIMNADLSGYLV